MRDCVNKNQGNCTYHGGRCTYTYEEECPDYLGYNKAEYVAVSSEAKDDFNIPTLSNELTRLRAELKHAVCDNIAYEQERQELQMEIDALRAKLEAAGWVRE